MFISNKQIICFTKHIELIYFAFVHKELIKYFFTDKRFVAKKFYKYIFVCFTNNGCR